MTITYLLGDTREMVATIADGSVSLVACSPPFIALRSYLPADHPMKHAEIGSEPDPATFIDTLLALTAEWGRVLAPWGSIAIELGDTYAGSGGGGGDYALGGLREGQDKFEGSAYNARQNTKMPKVADATATGGGITNLHGKVQGGGAGWPRPKCLALVPQAYALSLAYGRNVLNGNDSPAGQWLVRNMIVWHRPNPAVGALGDKYRPSTSYIVVATRSAKRWFDLTAVRTTPTSGPAGAVLGPSRSVIGYAGKHRPDKAGESEQPHLVSNPAGAPPLDAWFDGHDTWTLTTQPSSLAHYAMWPAKLAERLVLSMCPAEVCGECGEPRRRVEGKAEYVNPRTGSDVTTLHMRDGARAAEGVNNWSANGATCGDTSAVRVAPTLGWTDCGHDAYRSGVVLDPFGGTGTTNAVAELHGRDSIWIDIDERNRALVPQRMAEVSRSLFGTKPEVPGQEALFG